MPNVFNKEFLDNSITVDYIIDAVKENLSTEKIKEYSSFLALISADYDCFTIDFDKNKYLITPNKIFFIYNTEEHNIEVNIITSGLFGIFIPYKEIDRFINNSENELATKSEIKKRLFDIQNRYLTRDEEIDNLITNFMKRASFQDKISENDISFYKQLIISYLYRKQSSSEIASSIQSPEDPLLERVREASKYINANFDKDINLDDIASKVACNKYSFSHKFKKEIGISPYQYLIKQRLKKAKELLLYTNLSVNNISEKVGFSNYNSFYKLFLKEFKITPLSMRERFQKNN